MKRIVLLYALQLLVVCGFAQTVRWMVAPEYASITHYSNDIFKCVDQNGKQQLLDWNGKTVLENIDFDAVTEYSDGYAIVLQGERILGFLAEGANHSFQPVSGDYYATKYSFFSEGYVTVANKNGKQGYLDSKGYLVLECKYSEAMPVRKGRALVMEDKDRPRFKRVEDWSATGMNGLRDGTSFKWATSFNSSGLALARLGNNKREYVVIDVNFNEIEKKKDGSKDMVNPFDYSYNPDGSQEDGPSHNAKPVKNNGYSIYDEAGRKGYKASNEKFVPAQFSAAEDFFADRAIVSVGNGYGIIELLDGKFEPNWSAERIRVYEYANEAEPLQFMLSVPASLESDKVKLELDKGDKRYVDYNGLNFDLADQVIKRKTTNCELRAKATYTDKGFPELLLWEDHQTVGIDYISIGLSSPVVSSEYADENDNQTVKAVVTNTSDVAVKVSATLNVAGSSTPFNGVLNPNQSQTLKVTVKVDNDKQVQATVSAKVDKHDCGSNSAYVSLKKI